MHKIKAFAVIFANIAPLNSEEKPLIKICTQKAKCKVKGPLTWDSQPWFSVGGTDKFWLVIHQSISTSNGLVSHPHFHAHRPWVWQSNSWSPATGSSIFWGAAPSGSWRPHDPVWLTHRPTACSSACHCGQLTTSDEEKYASTWCLPACYIHLTAVQLRYDFIGLSLPKPPAICLIHSFFCCIWVTAAFTFARCCKAPMCGNDCCGYCCIKVIDEGRKVGSLLG